MRTAFKKYLAQALKTEDFSEALQRVEERLLYCHIDSGRSMSPKLMATILNIYSKAGEWEKAYELFDSVRQKSNPHFQHVKLDAFHYQIVIDACKNSKYNYHSMDEERDSSLLLPFEIATEVLQHMVDRCKSGSKTMSEPTLSLPFRTVTALQAPLSDSDKTLQTMPAAISMRSGNARVIRASKWAAAPPVPTALHFTSAMSACMKAQQYDAAYDIFIQARDVMHVVPDTILFNAALNCLVHLSTASNTGNAASQLHLKGLAPSITDGNTNIGSKFYHKGAPLIYNKYNITVKDVVAFFNTMDLVSSSAAGTEDGAIRVCKDSYSYGAMIKLCSRLNDYESALRYLQEANNSLLANRGLVQLVLDFALRQNDKERANQLAYLLREVHGGASGGKRSRFAKNLLPNYIIPNSAMMALPANQQSLDNKLHLLDEDSDFENYCKKKVNRLDPSMLSAMSANPESLKRTMLKTTSVSRNAAGDAAVSPFYMLSGMLQGGNQPEHQRPPVPSNTLGSSDESQRSKAGITYSLDKNTASMDENAIDTVSRVGTNIQNSSIAVIGERNEHTNKEGSNESNNQHLVRRATHNLSGTTNGQMLNIAPVASYSAQLYTLATTPMLSSINNRSRRLSIGQIPRDPESQEKDILISNAAAALKLYKGMKQKGIPIRKSHLINVMLACEREFDWRSGGHAQEGSELRSPAALTVDYPVISTCSKRLSGIDYIFREGLRLKIFRSLKIDSKRREEITGKKISLRQKKKLKRADGAVVKCELRRGLSNVDVVRKAAIRHFMYNTLPEYFMDKQDHPDDHSSSETGDSVKFGERKSGKYTVKNNFMFIVGNNINNSEKHSLAESVSISTDLVLTGVDFALTVQSAEASPEVQEIAKQVISSIEPMGILEIVEGVDKANEVKGKKGEHKKQKPWSGCVLISRDSLQSWLDTRSILAQNINISQQKNQING